MEKDTTQMTIPWNYLVMVVSAIMGIFSLHPTLSQDYNYLFHYTS